MTFGRMAQQNEITALKSAGVNLYNIIKPAILFGSLVGIGLCLFNNFILPEMNYNARLLARDIYKKKPELSIEPGYFVDMIPQYTMIVKEMDGKDFKDVKIFSKNQKSEQTTIYANQGSLSSDGNMITIDLMDGEIHEIDLSDYDYYRKIKFKTHPDYNLGTYKYLLREVMRDYLPKHVRSRKKKVGWSSPWDNNHKELTRLWKLQDLEFIANL